MALMVLHMDDDKIDKNFEQLLEKYFEARKEVLTKTGQHPFTMGLIKVSIQSRNKKMEEN